MRVFPATCDYEGCPVEGTGRVDARFSPLAPRKWTRPADLRARALCDASGALIASSAMDGDCRGAQMDQARTT